MPHIRRLLFQAEFRPALMAGTKSATIRRASSHHVKALVPGDIVVGVDGLFTRVADGFARFEVTEIQSLRWSEITEDHLARTCATREWYEARYGEAVESTLWKFIGLRLIREDLGG